MLTFLVHVLFILLEPFSNARNEATVNSAFFCLRPRCPSSYFKVLTGNYSGSASQAEEASAFSRAVNVATGVKTTADYTK